jgi:hypothetical protein
VIGHALVDSFIPSAEKNDAIKLRKPSRSLLTEKFPGSRQKHNSRLRRANSWMFGAAQAVANKGFGRFE